MRGYWQVLFLIISAWQMLLPLQTMSQRERYPLLTQRLHNLLTLHTWILISSARLAIYFSNSSIERPTSNLFSKDFPIHLFQEKTFNPFDPFIIFILPPRSLIVTWNTSKTSSLILRWILTHILRHDYRLLSWSGFSYHYRKLSNGLFLTPMNIKLDSHERLLVCFVASEGLV